MAHGLYMDVPNWSTYLKDGSNYRRAHQFIEIAYQREPLITEMCFELRWETELEMSKEETQEMMVKIAKALLLRRRLTQQECKELL